MKNVLILDNKKIVLEGLSLLLEGHSEIQEIYSAQNLEEANSFFESVSIDIAIIDLNLGTNVKDGTQVCKNLKKFHPKIKVIVLTGYLKVELIDPLFNQIQVDAYVSKDSGKLHLFEAIDTVIAGGRYLDAEAQAILDNGKFMRLTNREIEVLDLLSSGYVKKQIAEKLGLSVHTVRRHIDNVFEKFSVSNSIELCGKYNLYKSSDYESFEEHLPPFKH